MVYGGEHATLESASARERQLKRWSREKKQALVHHSARSASIGWIRSARCSGPKVANAETATTRHPYRAMTRTMSPADTRSAMAQEEPEEQRHRTASCGCHLIEAGDVRDLQGGFDLSGEGPQP